MRTAANNNKPRRAALSQAMILLVMPLSVLWLELIAKLFVFGCHSAGEFFLTVLTALTGGAILSAVFSLLKKKPRFICTAATLCVFAVLFSVHAVYYNYFHSPFAWSLLGVAGDATEFWREALGAIWSSFLLILLNFVPFVLFLIFGKRLRFLRKKRHFLRVVACVAAAALLCGWLIFAFAVKDNRDVYRSTGRGMSDILETYRHYGVLGGGFADIVGMMFGFSEEPIDNPYATLTDRTDPPTDNTDATDTGTDVPAPVVYGDNVLPIDFDALIAGESNKTVKEMHEYFSTVPATKQNEYTGMFEGKNLIFLSLEGFSSKAIRPDLTPTLYKMATEGFVFTNFYDSMWGGSTASGEYSNMTGNFYTTGTCLKVSAKTLTYSALGNMFRSSGYETFAYHNNTYTYYGRDGSHPNFGYTYKGIGNGLTLPHKYWPNSDLEMGQASGPDYIRADRDKPFHAYYMTVSGHANYDWSGNRMCSLHRGDIPADYPYSENVKAYFACQLEVELMLADLIQQLDAAGILEDTVFAMCCDHYPYALSDGELAELYGLPEKDIRSNFEMYKNAFILWSASMEEPIVIDKPCSSYDIAPTLYNLFGLSYDSRVITGNDILAPNENIVILNTLSGAGSWNWITDKGTYYTAKKTFVPAEGVQMSDEEQSAYVSLTNRKVAAMRKYSMGILEQDYYRYVFNSDFSLKAKKAG